MAGKDIMAVLAGAGGVLTAALDATTALLAVIGHRPRHVMDGQRSAGTDCSLVLTWLLLGVAASLERQSGS